MKYKIIFYIIYINKIIKLLINLKNNILKRLKNIILKRNLEKSKKIK